MLPHSISLHSRVSPRMLSNPPLSQSLTRTLPTRFSPSRHNSTPRLRCRLRATRVSLRTRTHRPALRNASPRTANDPRVRLPVQLGSSTSDLGLGLGPARRWKSKASDPCVRREDRCPACGRACVVEVLGRAGSFLGMSCIFFGLAVGCMVACCGREEG
jgi:hypothetical protein